MVISGYPAIIPRESHLTQPHSREPDVTSRGYIFQPSLWCVVCLLSRGAGGHGARVRRREFVWSAESREEVGGLGCVCGKGRGQCKASKQMRGSDKGHEQAGTQEHTLGVGGVDVEF